MEKEVNELKNVDHSLALLAKIKSKVLTIVNEYLGTSLDDALYKKSVEDICKIKMEHIEKQQEPKYEIVSFGVDTLREFDQKRTLFETMTKPAKKRKPDDADRDECPPDGSNQGLKRAKTSKDVGPSKNVKSTESSKYDMGNTDELPVVNVDLKDWFKKLERPLTPDPEWNELHIGDPKDKDSMDMLPKGCLNMICTPLKELLAVQLLKLNAMTLQPQRVRNSAPGRCFNPQGVIYEDKLNRKRLMRCDELYKFSDEIDHHLQERRLMRSLEKFIGGRHYGEDLRLLQRTIWLCDILSYFLRSRLRREAIALVDLIELDLLLKIIMVNVIPPGHMDDVPAIEPNQHDDVPVVPEPVLEDEDEDPKEEEFKEEEEPQEEKDDMEVNIEEDENKLELTYPYEEVDPLNPPPPTFESEPEDVIEVENMIEHEDETVPASVYERLYGASRAHCMVEKKGKAKDEYYGKLILDLGNEMRSSVEQGTTTMEKLVEKFGNAEDKAESKKLKKELGEARYYSVRGFVFEERPNEAINVPIEDEKSPSSEPRGSPRDS
ncbi:hypothetical protein Tco_0030842 [Tanacetum coccineum]